MMTFVSWRSLHAADPSRKAPQGQREQEEGHRYPTDREARTKPLGQEPDSR